MPIVSNDRSRGRSKAFSTSHIREEWRAAEALGIELDELHRHLKQGLIRKTQGAIDIEKARKRLRELKSIIDCTEASRRSRQIRQGKLTPDPNQPNNTLWTDRNGRPVNAVASFLLATYEATGESKLVEAFEVLNAYGLAGPGETDQLEELRRNLLDDPELLAKLVDMKLDEGMSKRRAFGEVALAHLAEIHRRPGNPGDLDSGRKRVQRAYERVHQVKAREEVAAESQNTPQVGCTGKLLLVGNLIYRERRLEIENVRRVPDNKAWRERIARGDIVLFPSGIIKNSPREK